MYVSSKGLRVIVTIFFIYNYFLHIFRTVLLSTLFLIKYSCEKHFSGISETPRNEMNNFSPAEQVTHKTQMSPLGIRDIS